MLIRLFAVCFVVGMTLSVLAGQLPQLYLWIYVAASVLTLILYRRDKTAARHKQRRTPEITFHVLALIGGWPGALVAQTLFHHKSKKPSFQRVFWITIFFNCILLAGFTSSGIEVF